MLDRLPEAPLVAAPEAPLVAPPEAPLEDEAPPADPVAEPPVVVLGVAAVGLTFVVAGTVDAEVRVPSVTMPLLVTPPGVAAVCANAGKAAAIETSTA